MVLDMNKIERIFVTRKIMVTKITLPVGVKIVETRTKVEFLGVTLNTKLLVPHKNVVTLTRSLYTESR